MNACSAATHRILRAIETAEALQSDTVGKVINIDGRQADVPRFCEHGRRSDGHRTRHRDGPLRRPISRGGEECGASARNYPRVMRNLRSFCIASWPNTSSGLE